MEDWECGIWIVVVGTEGRRKLTELEIGKWRRMDAGYIGCGMGNVLYYRRAWASTLPLCFTVFLTIHVCVWIGGLIFARNSKMWAGRLDFGMVKIRAWKVTVLYGHV